MDPLVANRGETSRDTASRARPPGERAILFGDMWFHRIVTRSPGGTLLSTSTTSPVRSSVLSTFGLCSLFTLALALAFALPACSKKEPPPAPSTKVGDAAPEPPDLGPKGFVAPPPGLVPQDEPDAAAPFGKVTDWSKATLPGTKITFKYPGEIFLMDEDKTGVLLSSPIAVEAIPDDSGTAQPPYFFRMKLTLKSVGVVDAAKAEQLSTMFPGDKKEAFVEINGLAKKLSVANHASYMQRLIVHGFNASVMIVELAPKKTLVVRVETVGEELRPRVAISNWHPESWQLKLADAVLDTLDDPATPRAVTKDAGK